MKAKLLYTTFLSTILLLAGCVKDDNMQFQSGPEATLSLNVHSRTYDSNDPESRVENVRVASVVPTSATTSPGILEVNGGVQKLPDSGKITQILRTGIRDIYVFANEDRVSGMTAALDAMRNFDQMKDIQIPYAPSLAPPFMCSSVVSAVDIKKEENTSIETKVVRTVSKVNLTLQYEWGGQSLPEELVVKSVQVMKLPSYSYLIKKEYDGGNYVNSESIADPTELANTLTGDDAKSQYKSKPLTIYIPEFWGATAANHSFLEIKGEIKSTGVVCSYRIPLSNSMGANGSINNSDYNITRNTKFSIVATIKSYGEVDGLFVKVTVLPWEMINQDAPVGGYVSFIKATNNGDVTIDENSILDDQRTTLKAVCKTNIGGWYTVTQDMDGTIVHRSSPTASVLEATEQTVDITIPPLAELAQEYTVSIYHPTIAQESVGPVKSLHFIQEGGFIPNSVLLTGGWPADKLPKTGLQLARRGNVLPSETSGTEDPTMPWSTESEKTGIISKELGSGKGNYALLNALDATKYPIGRACKNLGPEWYVPSVDELSLINSNKSTFGSSYTFIDTDYWSASQYTTDNSWIVSFESDYVFDNAKTNDGSVRCVREI